MTDAVTRIEPAGDRFGRRGSRLASLDAIRGVAILLVMAWHYLPQPSGPVHTRAFALIRALNVLSWSGVDLFFVLSGFLIGGILIDNRLASNYFRTFYIRRAFRILPLYAVVLALAALHPWPDTRGASFIPYLLFQQNAMVPITGAFGLRHLEVTWSLAIEEQFYLLAPLVVRYVPPRRLPVVLGAAVLVPPVCRALLWLTCRPDVAALASFTLLPCRMDALAVGALVAYAVRTPRWAARIARPRLRHGVAAVAGLLGLVVPILGGWWYRSPYVSVMGFSFLAIFYGAVLLDGLTTRAAAWAGTRLASPLTTAGVGAYSLYLFHLSIRDWLSATLGPRASAGPEIVYVSLLVALNAGVAVAGWRCIERPLMRIGHRYQYRPAAPEGVEPVRRDHGRS
jgi:peptidoglycan/LPS O-acetylase OafA/YrhL